MAQYRLSAHVISRSSGRSATAAAAYRAGLIIEDMRTGLVHDYSRKEGVLHSEIMAPANAPEWMKDRAQLWNAVEAAERRRDAQLAREIQLSLPHELSQAQQIELVRRFVAEQHVARGMIADIAIHAPCPAGDERNTHVHVMLTMRELVGGGFGKKERAWNSPEVLQEWRESWAAHQNREFERLGLAERVDHRSLEEQGILREPTQHLGPIACEIERDGRTSHRGRENREIEQRNGLRADLLHSENLIDAKIAFEKRKFEAWAEKKRDQMESDGQERMGRLQVGLVGRMAEFERQIDAEFSQTKAGLSRSHEQVAERLQVRGWRKLIRDITFTTRADRREQERLERELESVRRAEETKRAAQAKEEEQRRQNAQAAQERLAENLERGIESARGRRESEGWISGSLVQRSDQTADKAPSPASPMREEFKDAASPPQEPLERGAAGRDGDQAGGDKEGPVAFYTRQHQPSVPIPTPPPSPASERETLRAEFTDEQRKAAKAVAEAAKEPVQNPQGVERAAKIAREREIARANDNARQRNKGKPDPDKSRDR